MVVVVADKEVAEVEAVAEVDGGAVTEAVDD